MFEKKKQVQILWILKFSSYLCETTKTTNPKCACSRWMNEILQYYSILINGWPCIIDSADHPYWIRIDIWQGSWNFTTLIRTIFPGCSWFLIAFWQGFHVFWWTKISVTIKTMKNHEIPSTKFNVVSFCDVSWKFMKVEGIHLWIPWSFSWMFMVWFVRDAS